MPCISFERFQYQISQLGFIRPAEHDALFEMAQSFAQAAPLMVIQAMSGAAPVPSRQAAQMFLAAMVLGETRYSPHALVLRPHIAQMLSSHPIGEAQ